MHVASRRTLLVVLLVGFALRAAALWPAAQAQLVLDEQTYALKAVALLEGKGFVGSFQSWVRHPDLKPAEMPQLPGALQPPGYTAFIAGVMALSGRSLTAVRFAQVVLSTLTIALVFELGRAWWGLRSGLAAAWLCALYPDLIAFSHYLWSETLYVFLLVAGVCLLARGSQPPSRCNAALAGVALGLAALTRSAIVYFLPVLVAWLALVYPAQRRPALARGGLAMAVALLLIAPWTLRNQAVHGGFVLIDSNGPYNVWRGNTTTAFSLRGNPSLPRYAWPFESIPVHPVGDASAHVLIEAVARDTGNLEPTDLEVMDYASRSARAAILADPAGFLSRARYKLIDLWNPTSFLVRHLELNAYGALPRPLTTSLRFGAFASYALLMLFAVWGCLLTWRDPRTWMILAFTAYLTAISVLAFGLTRYRLPLMPFYCLLAGHAICALVDRRARQRDAA